MHKITSITLFFLFFLTANGIAQGKLLIIGGGSEKETEKSWNRNAYKWAVDQSKNKRVAIIAYGTATDWLPNYFLNQCGASTATNFNISTNEVANAQSTYDNLMAHDVIFIKGGDQYNYYSAYKGTKTQQAIEDKYNSGGVICGTSAGLAILSKIIFTAQNGTPISEESLINPNNEKIKLANDFFPFFPSHIFDSHFTNRGRFGRLLAFIAHWKFKQEEMITGIGLDEMTALSIDENKNGMVYGIGSANIYKAFSSNTFKQNGMRLLADSVKVIQLLQGCGISFTTGEISGFTQSRIPEIKEENGNYTIFASGGDKLAENTKMIADIVAEAGINSKVLIVTGNDQGFASDYKTEFIRAGATHVDIFSASGASADSEPFKIAIQNAGLLFFVNNKFNELSAFLIGGKAGSALNQKIRADKSITAFVGDNSRFIGKSLVSNYLETDAVYFGLLKTEKGLNLLKSTLIIPNTFSKSSLLENTNAAVPYAILKDTIKYGVWLNRDNYLKYKPNNIGKTYFYASGETPVIILKNSGTKSGFSIQSANGNQSDIPPNFCGFENMTLSLIDETTPYLVGDKVISTGLNLKNKQNVPPSFMLSNNELLVEWPETRYRLSIHDIMGKKVFCRHYAGKGKANLKTMPSGVYIATLQSITTKQTVSKKIVVP
jgi:cyanophycinase